MTKRERWIAVGLAALWALLYLPNLRSNPNWYGDEGEWMEKSWQLIHGKPRVGPIINDFIYPYPYPPLYMLVNGALLRVFGNDVVVGRALDAVTALAAAAVLFWIGCRLRDKAFGFLCAASFLVCTEAAPNFRWVRSHPMAGVLALASVGLLVRYVQEKQLRDAVWAGAFCSLATATNYFTYPLVGAVVLTITMVNWRAWRHIFAASAAAGAYAALFVAWYSATRGWAQLVNHAQLLTSVAANEIRPTLAGEIARFASNVWTLGFRTPTRMVLGQGPEGRDWWLAIATAGFLLLPVRRSKWLRAWLPFWLLVLMYGVFNKLNNVPLFFYPATIFLPLMAVGFAGLFTWAGEGWKRLGAPGGGAVPGIVACAVFGVITVHQAFTQFETKIEVWTQQSIPDAEATMQFVNDHTTSYDFVIVPKQIYWLVKNADRKSMLTYCARYEGIDNDMPVPTHIPRELFWFDCRLENAKYVVMEYGVREVVLPDGRRGQVPVGIDAVYTVPVLRGVRETVERIQQEKWPVVFHQGAYIVLANPRFVK
jgi:4-amino-4-deoxy-L-arabinose transferase-like glycosyltransferase